MINKEETLHQLQQLKLQGMSDCYQSIIQLPVHQLPAIHEMLAQMVQSEHQSRMDKKTKFFLQTSKLRYDSVLQNIICSSERNFTKEQLLELSDCGFVKYAQNILITGATGCGKSYMACALGRQACTYGFKTQYFGMTRFVERILQSRIDGTFTKLLEQLRKTDLIIIDDFGLVPLDQTIKLAILQILEDRYEKKATIIASQLPIDDWYDYLADATLADAIMDRLSSSAHKIFLKGNSLRNKKIENIV
jgi:DNA replication protein DnaC